MWSGCVLLGDWRVLVTLMAHACMEEDPVPHDPEEQLLVLRFKIRTHAGLFFVPAMSRLPLSLVDTRATRCLADYRCVWWAEWCFDMLWVFGLFLSLFNVQEFSGMYSKLCEVWWGNHGHFARIWASTLNVCDIWPFVFFPKRWIAQACLQLCWAHLCPFWPLCVHT